MKEVRIGLVGLGYIARLIGASFANNPGARVVAICDVSEEALQRAAAELPGSMRQYTDYNKMCREKDIDAVFVCTPNAMHVPAALAAVKNGKHVMVTKPLSDSVASAKRAVEAAEKAGVVNMMQLSTRFGSLCRYLGKLARNGEFGELYYARAKNVLRSGIPAVHSHICKSGGACRDYCSHVIDAAWWLLGMPKPLSVSAVAGAKFGPYGRGYNGDAPPPKQIYSKFESDDYAAGFIRFEGGIGMQVESFWASHHPKEELQVELFGTQAGAGMMPLTLYKTVEGGTQDITVQEPVGAGVWNVTAAHFIDCILHGVECTAPLRHGLIVQQMIEAMLDSAKTGREVRLDKKR